MPSASWCVLKGLPAAPPGIDCIIGVSTSIKPRSSRKRRISLTIFERVTNAGLNPEKLFFDPLIRPIATEPKQSYEFLKAIPRIKSLGSVRTICGLSNISFGLPDRRLVNATFLSMAMYAGLDAAILDPLDKYIISSLRASSALLATDEYCSEYIRAFREGKLI